ncbi:MAG: hypothetical protein ACK55Z_35500 [bacterium]
MNTHPCQDPRTFPFPSPLHLDHLSFQGVPPRFLTSPMPVCGLGRKRIRGHQ